jgi:hypothetical protein
MNKVFLFQKVERKFASLIYSSQPGSMELAEKAKDVCDMTIT